MAPNDIRDRGQAMRAEHSQGKGSAAWDARKAEQAAKMAAKSAGRERVEVLLDGYADDLQQLIDAGDIGAIQAALDQARATKDEALDAAFG